MTLSRFLPPLALLTLAALALPLGVRADDTENTPSFSQNTSDALEKLQPLIEAKNWQGAISLLQGVKTDPDSYDRAQIDNMLGKLFLQTDDLKDAIAPWTEALSLADRHSNYFTRSDAEELLLSLAQTYSELASANSKQPALQHEYFDKAAGYIHRWLNDPHNKPTVDIETFYADVLYQEATQDEKHVDEALVQQSRQAAIKATELTMGQPKEDLYRLIYITYAQENNYVEAAKYLEYLVQEYPTKGYWPQLMAAYVNLAGESDKNPDKQRDYYIRAINAVERAQAYGKLNTPKDNYNLFTLYYSAGQFGEATDLLYRDMRRGTIESTQKNWLDLAAALLQNSSYAQAIEVLKEAARRFPDTGEFDFQIAQIYSSQMDDSATAYRYIIPAIQKGNLTKPYSAYLYLAYLAYELEKLPQALQAADKALTYPQGRESKQLQNLRDAIENSIKQQKINAETIKAAAARSS